MSAAPASLSSFRPLTWPQRLWQDLQPSPGRLNAALRIVLTTVVALVLTMALQLPFASLSLYYIFLVARESPIVSVRSSVFAILTIVVAVATELAVVVLTDNDPMARVLSVGIVSFIAGILMVASTLPALASIWGFIYCTLIALWERPVPSDALVKSSLYLIATVGLAALVSSAVEYVFANRHPADDLARQMKTRFGALEHVFRLFAEGASGARLGAAVTALNRLAATGQRPMQELYNAALERDLSAKSLPAGARVRITALAQLMDVAAAFASQHPDGVAPDLRVRCAEIAGRCQRQDEPGGEAESPDRLGGVEAALRTALLTPAEGAAEKAERIALPARKVPFLIPGAATNPDTVAFALKLTLCVVLCYVFYFAVDWPGISTSVTTIFITALGNSGAIKQKLFNRLLGSVIGGVLAILASVFLFPQMDSITSLVILIGSVAFLAAWWAGGRHFGYAGLQIAFSFYLVAFEGFRAPTELTPPRDRLVGIFVAVAVMWLVFDHLWPVRTITAMRRALASVLRGEARLLRILDSGPEGAAARMSQVDGLRDQISRTIAGLRTMNDTVEYEFGLDRAAQGSASESILRAALGAVPFFWNQLAVLYSGNSEEFLSEPGLIEMRRRAAMQMDAMADAVTRNEPLAPAGFVELADLEMLEDPRYGEYVAHTIEGHEELKRLVAACQNASS